MTTQNGGACGADNDAEILENEAARLRELAQARKTHAHELEESAQAHHGHAHGLEEAARAEENAAALAERKAHQEEDDAQRNEEEAQRLEEEARLHRGHREHDGRSVCRHDHAYEHGHESPRVNVQFKIRIDKKEFTTTDPDPTGAELLALAGKTPVTRYQIFRRLASGELKQIALGECVCLSPCETERFVTLPLDQTEGFEQEGTPPRRDFTISEVDQDDLDRMGLRWETVSEGGVARLVMRDYPVCHGYNYAKVDVNLRIERGYPETQIDMVYVFPPLARSDGRPIGALADDHFEGRTWQRWSRHRTGQNPWRPGVDCVATHLALVDNWFARELTKA